MVDTVLFVDDDEDLREVMQDALARLGVRSVVAAGSLGDVQYRRAEALTCDIAILDINLGADQPSGVSVYEWLEREGFAGRIIFLTGHASNDPRVRAAARLNAAHIVSKPVSIAELGGLIEVASSAR